MSKATTITFRIDEQEKEVLKEIAEAKDVPVSQIIREAIKSYINK